MFELTQEEKEIMLEALKEYEENNYFNRDDNWQAAINKLISLFKNEVK